MSDSKQLPAWPTMPPKLDLRNGPVGDRVLVQHFDRMIDYYIATNAFYESRLRVAVEALTTTRDNSPESVAGKRAVKALALIGQLPQKETT